MSMAEYDEDRFWELIDKSNLESTPSQDVPSPRESSKEMPPAKSRAQSQAPEHQSHHQDQESRNQLRRTRASSVAAESSGQSSGNKVQKLKGERLPARPQYCPVRSPILCGLAAIGDMAYELNRWRGDGKLREELTKERAKAMQAERAAEMLRTYIRERELQLQSAVATHNETISQEASRLTKENAQLRTELDDARSHIFSLQPYRQELTPKEVERDFDDLVTSISSWVQKYADPIVDDPKNFKRAVEKAREHPQGVAGLKHFISQNPDLIHGCLYPETDVDILLAIVFRYINEMIFQKGMSGPTTNQLAQAISQIEASMHAHVEPKRDQFALRTWRAEAYTAILSSPSYLEERARWRRNLVTELCQYLRLFCPDGQDTKLISNWHSFCINCQDAVMEPAIRLSEKLMTSTHHFYMDYNPYIVWNSQRELEMIPEFFANLHTLECDNILQHRKRFSVDKLSQQGEQPSLEELKAKLTNVLTVVPGMYVRHVGKGDAIREPQVVRKQQVLVAYDSQETRERFMDRGEERTLMNYIHFGHKGEKVESASRVWGRIGWGGQSQR